MMKMYVRKLVVGIMLMMFFGCSIEDDDFYGCKYNKYSLTLAECNVKDGHQVLGYEVKYRDQSWTIYQDTDDDNTLGLCLPSGYYTLVSMRREIRYPDGRIDWEHAPNTVPNEVSFSAGSDEDMSYTEVCKSINLGKISF